MQSFFANLNLSLPILLIVGIVVLISFYIGKSMKYIRLPSLIGYMILGVIFGPSLFNLLNESVQVSLSFITEIALALVALSIGFELKLSSLKKLGSGIVWIIFVESFGAFILVFTAVFLYTGNLPLALIFGGIAPASAPAGTVAVIQEYKARGLLTKSLYAIVGFDDGLGIIIFGFAAAIARSILIHQTGVDTVSFFELIWLPFKEILISLAIGGGFSIIISLLVRKLENSSDILIILITFIFISVGISHIFHISIILTNMVVGMIIVNTQGFSIVRKISERLPIFMPLLFILFFTLAGANLYIKALPSLGLLGIIYVFARASGKFFGSKLGAIIGKANENIRKYVGLGILSQAGVAIGLAIMVKQEFKGLGNVINTQGITTGDNLGAIVITTVTATCIFFEIIGPILTKYALTKAGEINKSR
ncbi:MAG: cation:proton antiporter [Candidatus Marinimicrobia bacterium]|nr:cation:proton antiporter [Candidatus Neomarinimicrobiota bacterium]